MKLVLHKINKADSKPNSLQRQYKNNADHELHAFTLLELMISAVITTILIVGLTIMLGTVTKNWETGTSNRDTFNEARIALRAIREDLQSVYRRSLGQPNFPPLYIRGGAFAGTGNTGDIRSIDYGNPDDGYGSSNISFFATLPNEKMPDSNTDIGDIGIISYYVHVDSTEDASGTNNGLKTQKLYRHLIGSRDSLDPLLTFVSSPNTHNFIINSGSHAINATSNNSANFSILKVLNDSGSRIDVRDAEPIAFNVVQFLVIPYRLDNSGNLVNYERDGWPYYTGTKPSNEDSSVEVVLDTRGSAPTDRLLPDCVDVILRITDPATSKIISSVGVNGKEWKGDTNKDAIKNLIVSPGYSGTPTNLEDVEDIYRDAKKVKTFRTRIYFPQKTD